MSFKDTVRRDNTRTFMNQGEFAEKHSIIYDGETYPDVSCVITQLKAKDRTTTVKDHAQGVYLVSSIFHCPLESLDGHVPEKGAKIRISDDDFWRDFYVAQSGCDLDMIRLELEALDE